MSQQQSQLRQPSILRDGNKDDMETDPFVSDEEFKYMYNELSNRICALLTLLPTQVYSNSNQCSAWSHPDYKCALVVPTLI